MGQVENKDYYVCKLPNCGAVIQFETYGARSKILNLYTSQFYRELDYSYPDPRDWLHTLQEGADEGHLIRVKIRMNKLCDQVTIVINSLFNSP